MATWGPLTLQPRRESEGPQISSREGAGDPRVSPWGIWSLRQMFSHLAELGNMERERIIGLLTRNICLAWVRSWVWSLALHDLLMEAGSNSKQEVRRNR